MILELTAEELEAVRVAIRTRLDYLNLLQNAGAHGRTLDAIELERRELHELLAGVLAPKGGVMPPA